MPKPVRLKMRLTQAYGVIVVNAGRNEIVRERVLSAHDCVSEKVCSIGNEKACIFVQPDARESHVTHQLARGKPRLNGLGIKGL